MKEAHLRHRSADGVGFGSLVPGGPAAPRPFIELGCIVYRAKISTLSLRDLSALVGTAGNGLGDVLSAGLAHGSCS